MNREDWLLLVLAAADGEIMTATRIHKVLFLVTRHQEGDLPNFKPGPYGPHSDDVGPDLELLESRGLVFTIYRDRQTMHAASVAGWKRAAELPVPQHVREHAASVASWAQREEFNSLWHAMKENHPEMCTQ